MSQNTKRCESCTKEFTCDASGGNCWCFKFPHILAIEPNKNCVCPECLEIKISEYVADVSFDGTFEDMLKIATACQGLSKRNIEGLDFYMENGFCVFTAWFLLKRGYCCEKRCRHCPYH